MTTHLFAGDAAPAVPEELVAEARRLYDPIASVCLFSGGGDSAVLAHRCRDLYDFLAFIDTGTAVPGVRDHVVRFADWLGKPLRIFEAGDAFREMVLGGRVMRDGRVEGGHGFPGPGQHYKAYSRLKERQIDALMREVKVGHPRRSTVLLLSGVRRAESSRRSSREPITKHYGKVFCNPLIDWSDEEMRAYRREHRLPESDVAALLHRSGECNCGSFAAPGEREMLQSLWPEWFEATIASLEREAAEAGIPACRWGVRPPRRGESLDAGPLCSSCVAAQEQLDLEVA